MNVLLVPLVKPLALAVNCLFVPAASIRSPLNVAVPPAPSANALGVVGGDLAGYPNGRRVSDDVTTIAIRAVAGITYPLVNKSYTPDAAVPESGETHVVEAYEAYSKGLLNLRAVSTGSLDRAVLFFERAVQLDPRYARAHLQLGEFYHGSNKEKAIAHYKVFLAQAPTDDIRPVD